MTFVILIPLWCCCWEDKDPSALDWNAEDWGMWKFRVFLLFPRKTCFHWQQANPSCSQDTAQWRKMRGNLPILFPKLKPELAAYKKLLIFSCSFLYQSKLLILRIAGVSHVFLWFLSHLFFAVSPAGLSMQAFNLTVLKQKGSRATVTRPAC